MLVYVAFVMGGWTQHGLMTTGPFPTEAQCRQAAHRVWDVQEDWNMGETSSNFYDSRFPLEKRSFRETEQSGMVLLWSCVEAREWRE